MRAAGSLIVVVIFLLQGCASAATPSAETPDPASVAPSATPSATPASTMSPAVSASPTVTGPELSGQLVPVVTQDLVVRSRPGTGADSEIYSVSLSAPTTVYVIAGPEAADGYEWYLVDPLAPPCYIGCDFAPRAGWVAAAGKDGERWLGQVPERPTCSEAPTLDQLLDLLPELWLHCYGGRELTLEGHIEASSEAPPHWPWQYKNQLYHSGYSPPGPECQDCFTPSVLLAHDSDIGVPYLPGGSRITGHFDDPDAQECQPLGSDADSRLVTYECRTVFVVTSGW